MNLEILIWAVSIFFLSEVLFILAYKYNWFGFGSDWVSTKFISFLIVGFFAALNFSIVCGLTEEAVKNYSNLIWLYLLLGTIGIIILLNYIIKLYIDKKDENIKEY